MAWPLETVRLFDSDLSPVETWEGWMVPATLDLLANDNANCSYRIEVGAPAHWATGLEPGPLYDVVWAALQRYQQWLSTPSHAADNVQVPRTT